MDNNTADVLSLALFLGTLVALFWIAVKGAIDYEPTTNQKEDKDNGKHDK